VDFGGASLCQADMSGAILRFARFIGVDMTSVKLCYADLTCALMPDGSIHE